MLQDQMQICILLITRSVVDLEAVDPEVVIVVGPSVDPFDEDAMRALTVDR